MSELRQELHGLVQGHILGAQNDGVQLGIKFSAKTLRDIADGCAQDPKVAPDYIRGLRDAAVLIEQFGASIKDSL